jgi:L-rhamnonate dehydratase
MSLFLGLKEDPLPSPSCPRIVAVRAYVTRAEGYGSSDVHDTPDTHWIMGQPPHWPPIANPMSFFPKYAESRASWGVAKVPTFIVEIEQEDGLVGIGASCGGEAACFIVEHHLSQFVEGQDVRNIKLIWEQCFRASIHYGRKGLGIHCVSAIDLALWDLLGKVKGEPVYNLLGGKTTERVPCYCTTARPDLAKELGFFGAKFPLPYGPAAGNEGMRKNVECCARWREKCGPDFPLMLDCYMALDVGYAAELARKLMPYDIKWMEEMLMPDEYEAHKKLSRKMEAMGCTSYHATGEHEYTRWGFKQLINSGVGLIQPDVMWMGGPTEFARVAALASAHGVAIVPHGCGVYGYFMAMAFPNIPLCEFMMMSETADEILPNFGDMFVEEPLPENGYISLPDDRPGWGLTLNREKLNLARPFPRDGSGGSGSGGETPAASADK